MFSSSSSLLTKITKNNIDYIFNQNMVNPDHFQMSIQILQIIYSQFSRRKYLKYKLQYPRMTQSELVNKIIRQWQSLNIKQKFTFCAQIYEQGVFKQQSSSQCSQKSIQKQRPIFSETDGKVFNKQSSSSQQIKPPRKLLSDVNSTLPSTKQKIKTTGVRIFNRQSSQQQQKKKKKSYKQQQQQQQQNNRRHIKKYQSDDQSQQSSREIRFIKQKKKWFKKNPQFNKALQHIKKHKKSRYNIQQDLIFNFQQKFRDIFFEYEATGWHLSKNPFTVYQQLSKKIYDIIDINVQCAKIKCYRCKQDILQLQLIEHVKKCTQQNQIQCSNCQQFFQKQKMELHIQSKCKKSSRKKIKCYFCKLSINKDYFIQHLSHKHVHIYNSMMALKYSRHHYLIYDSQNNICYDRSTKLSKLISKIHENPNPNIVIIKIKRFECHVAYPVYKKIQKQQQIKYRIKYTPMSIAIQLDTKYAQIFRQIKYINDSGKHKNNNIAYIVDITRYLKTNNINNIQYIKEYARKQKAISYLKSIQNQQNKKCYFTFSLKNDVLQSTSNNQGIQKQCPYMLYLALKKAKQFFQKSKQDNLPNLSLQTQWIMRALPNLQKNYQFKHLIRMIGSNKSLQLFMKILDYDKMKFNFKIARQCFMQCIKYGSNKTQKIIKHHKQLLTEYFDIQIYQKNKLLIHQLARKYINNNVLNRLAYKLYKNGVRLCHKQQYVNATKLIKMFQQQQRQKMIDQLQQDQYIQPIKNLKQKQQKMDKDNFNVQYQSFRLLTSFEPKNFEQFALKIKLNKNDANYKLYEQLFHKKNQQLQTINKNKQIQCSNVIQDRMIIQNTPQTKIKISSLVRLDSMLTKQNLKKKKRAAKNKQKQKQQSYQYEQKSQKQPQQKQLQQKFQYKLQQQQQQSIQQIQDDVINIQYTYLQYDIQFYIKSYQKKMKINWNQIIIKINQQSKQHQHHHFQKSKDANMFRKLMHYYFSLRKRVTSKYHCQVIRWTNYIWKKITYPLKILIDQHIDNNDNPNTKLFMGIYYHAMAYCMQHQQNCKILEQRKQAIIKRKEKQRIQKQQIKNRQKQRQIQIIKNLTPFQKLQKIKIIQYKQWDQLKKGLKKLPPIFKKTKQATKQQFTFFKKQMQQFLSHKKLNYKDNFIIRKNYFDQSFQYIKQTDKRKFMFINDSDAQFIKGYETGKYVLPVKHVYINNFIGSSLLASRRVQKSQFLGPFNGLVLKVQLGQQLNNGHNMMTYCGDQDIHTWVITTCKDKWGIGPMYNYGKGKQANMKLQAVVTQYGIQYFFRASRVIEEGEHYLWDYGQLYNTHGQYLSLNKLQIPQENQMLNQITGIFQKTVFSFKKKLKPTIQDVDLKPTMEQFKIIEFKQQQIQNGHYMFGVYKDDVMLVLDTLDMQKQLIFKKLKEFQRIIIIKSRQYSNWQSKYICQQLIDNTLLKVFVSSANISHFKYQCNHHYVFKIKQNKNVISKISQIFKHTVLQFKKKSQQKLLLNTQIIKYGEQNNCLKLFTFTNDQIRNGHHMFGIYKDNVMIVLDTINMIQSKIFKKLKFFKNIYIIRYPQKSNWQCGYICKMLFQNNLLKQFVSQGNFNDIKFKLNPLYKQNDCNAVDLINLQCEKRELTTQQKMKTYKQLYKRQFQKYQISHQIRNQNDIIMEVLEKWRLISKNNMIPLLYHQFFQMQQVVQQFEEKLEISQS